MTATGPPAVGQEPVRRAFPTPGVGEITGLDGATVVDGAPGMAGGMGVAEATGAIARQGDGALPEGLRSWLRSPVGSTTASLVVPGAGQAALGLRRWPVYALLEVGLWWGWTEARSDFRGLRRSYRTLAWDAARLYDGARRDGSWGYYETMSQYMASGRYDADPAAGLQPEEDPDTYNGSVWQLAQSIYLPAGQADPDSPEYALALAYYGERAAGPEFLWSWEGRQAELARFRSLIGSADDASRRATGVAGLILANHLVSAIDALLVARLRSDDGPELRSRISPGGEDWQIELRIPHDGRIWN